MVGAYVEFGEYEKVMGLFTDITPAHPMYSYGAAMEVAMQGDFAGAAELVEDVIEKSENPRQFEISLAAGFAMLAGDFDTARKYAERHDPDFVADADPVVGAHNVADMIRYAYILQNVGEEQRADSLLDIALDFVQTLPRIGLFGHGIRDVQILALQGKPLDALAAFRDAIDEGFRGTVSSNGWPLAYDPYLSSLRGQPGFQAMVGELEDMIAFMRQRVADAEQSGDWSGLMALAEST